jgi:NADPH:quinone reductase-like Zn-dependent oxidoreductase
MGDPHRAAHAAWIDWRQAGGALSSRANVEAWWTDPEPAAKRKKEGDLMKAVVYDTYGPPEVLRLAEVERPVPREDEVLVKVHATTVNRSDVHIREANRRGGLAATWLSRMVSGLRRPRQPILGSEFAGEVAAAGAAVKEFAVGDRVFGSTGLRFGAHAEFVCVRESRRIAHMPAGMSFEQAAPICDGALNALMCLKQADLRKGRRILIYGASGAIGTAGVQLARYFDADVTAVCSTRNLELVKSLGADRVIDYTKEDFTKNGQTYHVIFDAVGKHSFKRSRDSLEPGGFFLPTDGFENLILALWPSRTGDKRVVFQIPPRQTKQDVLFLKELVETGKFRPVIDRCYPLEDVIEAAKYVETEHKTGNVVLTVGNGRAA